MYYKFNKVLLYYRVVEVNTNTVIENLKKFKKSK